MEGRSPMYLLFGLIIGIFAGLFYSFIVQPARYYDAAPHAMNDEFKDQYRYMAALSYNATGDLGRARSRFILLQDADTAGALDNQAQKLLGSGGSAQDAQALANLASILRKEAQPEAPAEQPAEGESNPLIVPTATLIPGVSP